MFSHTLKQTYYDLKIALFSIWSTIEMFFNIAKHSTEIWGIKTITTLFIQEDCVIVQCPIYYTDSFYQTASDQYATCFHFVGVKHSIVKRNINASVDCTVTTAD